MIFWDRTFFVLTVGRGVLSRSEVDLEESPIAYTFLGARAVARYEHCLLRDPGHSKVGMEAEWRVSWWSWCSMR